MPPADRPLPESLTRLLAAPAPRRPGATRGAGIRARPPGDPARLPDRPLDGLVLRLIVGALAGLVWLALLWTVLHGVLGRPPSAPRAGRDRPAALAQAAPEATIATQRSR